MKSKTEKELLEQLYKYRELLRGDFANFIITYGEICLKRKISSEEFISQKDTLFSAANNLTDKMLTILNLLIEI